MWAHLVSLSLRNVHRSECSLNVSLPNLPLQQTGRGWHARPRQVSGRGRTAERLPR